MLVGAGRNSLAAGAEPAGKGNGHTAPRSFPVAPSFQHTAGRSMTRMGLAPTCSILWGAAAEGRTMSGNVSMIGRLSRKTPPPLGDAHLDQFEEAGVVGQYCQLVAPLRRAPDARGDAPRCHLEWFQHLAPDQHHAPRAGAAHLHQPEPNRDGCGSGGLPRGDKVDPVVHAVSPFVGGSKCTTFQVTSLPSRRAANRASAWCASRSAAARRRPAS